MVLFAHCSKTDSCKFCSLSTKFATINCSVKISHGVEVFAKSFVGNALSAAEIRFQLINHA